MHPASRTTYSSRPSLFVSSMNPIRSTRCTIQQCEYTRTNLNFIPRRTYSCDILTHYDDPCTQYVSLLCSFCRTLAAILLYNHLYWYDTTAVQHSDHLRTVYGIYHVLEARSSTGMMRTAARMRFTNFLTKSLALLTPPPTPDPFSSSSPSCFRF